MEDYKCGSKIQNIELSQINQAMVTKSAFVTLFKQVDSGYMAGYWAGRENRANLSLGENVNDKFWEGYKKGYEEGSYDRKDI